MVKVEDTIVKIIHNGKLKTSGISKVMKHKPEDMINYDDEIADVVRHDQISRDEATTQPRNDEAPTTCQTSIKFQDRWKQHSNRRTITSRNSGVRTGNRELQWQCVQPVSRSSTQVLRNFNSSSYFTSFITDVWKLTAAAYGLVYSGRLWYLTSDSCLTEKFGLTKFKFEPTLYFRIHPITGFSFA